MNEVRSVNIHIDLSAIRTNLATARRCSYGSKLFATIKADAYGHGAVPVACALSPMMTDSSLPEGQELADGFAVVTVDEALELRQAGIRLPILVLQGPQHVDAIAEMRHHDLWPVIHDLQQYDWYRLCPERGSLNAWLKVDTGMGRLGVSPSEATRILASDDGVHWHGLLTHFACADEMENQFTSQQINTFNTVSYKQTLQRSMANSSAVLAWPDARSDWARPGIMLYGCNPLDRALPEGVMLRPAMSVTAPLVSVKTMKSGSGIGYAQSYRCPEDMPVGYVALGYRDGIPRVLNSHATVNVNGKMCSIIGRVSMDSLAVDLRPVPMAAPGDSTEIWGHNASIDSLASAANTINYELLTSIRGTRHYHGLSNQVSAG